MLNIIENNINTIVIGLAIGQLLVFGFAGG